MTPKERRNPDIIEASRRRRIARGAGVEPQEVSALVKSFTRMRDVMKQLSGMSMLQRMAATKAMAQGGLMEGAVPKLNASAMKFDPRKRDRKNKRRKRR
jgi:signal recognition particle subunit SRP54